MAKVALKDISKSFGKKEILKNINLDIKDGEFIVLVGASGCGKSTLLRMIAGLETQTEGDIYIDDTLVNNLSPKDRDIAMVFQSYALYPHLNVFDNVGFSLKIKNVPKCEIERRVQRACEILKLDDYINARPKELSGGQRQRVALARAIVREPKVFLMDEPLSNLDAKLRSKMRAEIKKLQQKLKATVIYVTHDQTEALTMGDRIVVLNQGEIQQVDTAQNIYNKPSNTFVATFMGANPMNIFEAEIKDGFLTFAAISINVNSTPLKDVTPRKLYVGVRPENIIFEKDPLYTFNTIKFSTKANFEENLGSFKNIYFEMGKKEYCASIDSKYEKQESYNFSIDTNNLLFFDYKTTELINWFYLYIWFSALNIALTLAKAVDVSIALPMISLFLLSVKQTILIACAPEPFVSESREYCL